MTDLDSTEIISADESFTEIPTATETKAALNVLSGADAQTFQLTKETTIGRANPSDFIIPASSLSKQHAKISISNGQYFITDLGSSNKTFHNKVQLQPNVCYALHDGDEVKFGDILCSFEEHKQPEIKSTAEVNNNPSTQTITNSYDDQEPSQPIKVWSEKNDHTNTPTNGESKQNGISESPNKSSSSFVSHPPSRGADLDDDDDLIIGSTTLPTAVPSVLEPKELNQDDQLEIISSPQTKTNPSAESTEMEDTPSINPQNDMETSIPAKPIVEQMENASPKVIEQTQEPEMIADDAPNQLDRKENVPEDEMETDPTTDSPSMVIDDKPTDNGSNDMEAEVTSTTMEQEAAPEVEKSLTTSIEEPAEKIDDPVSVAADMSSPTPAAEEEEEGEETTEGSALVSGRGVARKNARRARGRGAAARARVVSTRLHSGRRNPIVVPKVIEEENNTTLEETVSTETEESPTKTTPATPEVKGRRSKKSEVIAPKEESKQIDTSSNVRVSARIKERASSGRNRQFPYTDDYVDLDDLEKRSKTNTPVAATTTTTPTTATAAAGRTSKRGRASASPQKRISLRQQPIDASDSVKEKDKMNVYEEMDTVAENKEPTPISSSRKRKSTTPVAAVSSKRSRPATPQTLPTANTRRKQAAPVEVSPTVTKAGRRTTGGQKQAPPPPSPPPATTTASPSTPKRARKSTKQATPAKQSPEKASATDDRPIRIALSSHLNFEQKHFDILRQLGFEIMDESCQVDALVVDRIRRTKKFFMCLARGALILSPTWIEAMIKEHRYIPYEKYYLEDTNAETRYGFQLRESVQLAKQGPIFQNYKFFCTKDTSPPYDDLKDIIEAAGGKLIEKMNMSKPAKDTICIVAQAHKTEYEDLFKKGLAIVSEEFILSGISKQKLDFESFSLFQSAKTNPGK